MAENTNIYLRNDVIYSVYVRNHTKEGTFKAIIKDLERIKKLGTDIIWFMPIHPVGEKGKKGSLGCPYANRDYRTVNPEYGTMEEFKELVDEIHKLDMKCMIDVVYNHTSPDSWLVNNHPEFFYKKENGNFGNRVGDWTDVVDLNYDNLDLWDYQIESLKFWAGIVDGFRCDVASLVPVEFWKRARKAVSEVNPECIWLSESVHLSFLKYLRDMGIMAQSDSEIFNAFDILYPYDIWDEYSDYLDGKASLSKWIEAINRQECVYPTNYIKLRCLENHDQPRIKSRIEDEQRLMNITALNYFLKGTTMVYAGEEFENEHTPSLFEVDTIDYNTGKDISLFMRKLYDIKKDEIFATGNFSLKCDDEIECVIGKYETKPKENSFRMIIGIFSLGNADNEAKISVEIDDGTYINKINDEKIEVTNGKLNLNAAPAIIEV